MFTELFSEAFTSGIVPGDAESLVLKGMNYLNSMKYQEEIDSLNEVLSTEADSTMDWAAKAQLKDDKEKAKRRMKEVLTDKDLFAVYGNKGMYGVASMSFDKIQKLMDKVEVSGIESLTDSERRTLNVLMVGDALSIFGLDEGTAKSIRNKMWKILERRIEDKYTGHEVKIKTKPKFEPLKTKPIFKN
jgi:hypothetical protein